MKTIPYWHVDAFADRAFTGNQAAVMILEAWPDDAVLAAIGAENMFAETAFVVKDVNGETAKNSSEYELRWFTPACEVRLCGHATLAAGHVLLGLEPEREMLRFATRKAGQLIVRRDGASYQLALPAIPVSEAEWPAAVAALGGSPPSRVFRNPDRYNVFLYASAAEVLALGPDMRALAALGDHQFICTAPGSETDVVSRVFVPGAGVDEDSVTGSAHAVLTPLWAGLLGRDSFTAFQASARGGRLACRLDGASAWLGGNCVTVVEGSFSY